MIIDFHTHMFPDKIAARTIDFLSKTGGDMNPFTDGTWKGLKESTKQAGIDHSIVLPIATRPGQFHTINEFATHFQEGTLISFGSLHPESENYKEELKQIQDMGVPLVLFDRTAKELDVSKVVADDADAAFKIVQHLIHGGARRIALLTGPEQLSIGKNRMKGYPKAMTLNKLEINTDYIVRCEDFSVKAAKEATQRLLNMKNMPDAIFGINDDMAIGAIEAIKEKGLKIPEEVAVFGFSNSKRSRYMTPSVSTINQFPEKIGETAAELLFEQILDAKHAQIREEVINSELIVRESSDRSFMQ